MTRRLAVAAAILAVAACGNEPTGTTLTAGQLPRRVTNHPAALEVDTNAVDLHVITAHIEAARAARIDSARRAAREASRTRKATVPATGGDVWTRLARCESGMSNDGGAPHFGYFQFSAATWRSVGESGLPDQYPYAHQLAAAKRLQARSGWGPWPSCARKIGLR